MIELTEYETAVMVSLANNYYGDEGDGVWSNAVNDSHKPSGLSGKVLSGVVSSLCKKDLISSSEYEKGADVIWMRDAGKEWISANRNICFGEEVKAEPVKVGTIDMTPTWRAIVPVLIAALQDGTHEGKRLAAEELYRLADFADSMTKEAA